MRVVGEPGKEEAVQFYSDEGPESGVWRWHRVDQLDLDTFKAEIHRTLISKLDLEKLSRVNSSQARQAVGRDGQRDHRGPTGPLNFAEQGRLS